MSVTTHRNRGLLLVLVSAAFFAVAAAHAANVALVVNITQPLLDGDGNPLADGSVIYVIGSGDNVADGMQSAGGSLIANSTQGDDVIIATMIMDSSTTGVPGTMTAGFPGVLDTSTINFLYLRFFDYQGAGVPVGEDIAWGETDPQTYTGPFFGTAFLNVDGGQVSATNNFTVIPEPGTLHLFVVAGLVLALFCARRDSQGRPRKSALACKT